MNKVVLDTGPLNRILHPRLNADIYSWVEEKRRAGVAIYLPEIADYETRRSLLWKGLTDSLVRLDKLKQLLAYLPLNTEVMQRAAQFWADCRRRGLPTAPDDALDGDAILAAQALSVGAIVATENVGHLGLFVEARHWRDI